MPIKTRHKALIAFLVLTAAWTTAPANEQGRTRSVMGSRRTHPGRLKTGIRSLQDRTSPVTGLVIQLQNADLPALQFNLSRLPYIIDNGHTVMINYAPGSSFRVGTSNTS
jgi:hypothetical protein